MPVKKKTLKKSVKKSFEETLWETANKLQSFAESSEYKHFVLSLIFLKFVSEKISKRFMLLVKCLKAVCGIFIDSERDQIHFYHALRFIVTELTKGAT